MRCTQDVLYANSGVWEFFVLGRVERGGRVAPELSRRRCRWMLDAWQPGISSSGWTVCRAKSGGLNLYRRCTKWLKYLCQLM
jgi:hypothetical protein